jgi:hypothetical protein
LMNKGNLRHILVKRYSLDGREPDGSDAVGRQERRASAAHCPTRGFCCTSSTSSRARAGKSPTSRSMLTPSSTLPTPARFRWRWSSWCSGSARLAAVKRHAITRRKLQMRAFAPVEPAPAHRRRVTGERIIARATSTETKAPATSYEGGHLCTARPTRTWPT